MKKLVFAAIAAMVMVSVSNVFANNKMASVSSVAPVDTVAPAEAPADTTVKATEDSAEEKAAPAETPADSTTATTDTTVAQ